MGIVTLDWDQWLSTGISDIRSDTRLGTAALDWELFSRHFQVDSIRVIPYLYSHASDCGLLNTKFGIGNSIKLYFSSELSIPKQTMKNRTTQSLPRDHEHLFWRQFATIRQNL